MALLRIGSKGDDVAALQTKLNSYGFNAGSVDGIFGKNTASALKAFQKSAGITVDGIYGNQSATALSGYKPVNSLTSTNATQQTQQVQTQGQAQYNGLSPDDYKSKLMDSVRAGVMTQYEANVSIIKNNLDRALADLDTELAALEPAYTRQLDTIAQNKFASSEAAKEMMNQGGWNAGNSGLAIGEQTRIGVAADKNRAEAGQNYAMAQAEIARRRSLAQQTANTNLASEEAQKNARLAGAEADAIVQADARNWNMYQSNRDYDYQRMTDQRNFDYQKTADERDYNRSVLESDRAYALQKAAAARAAASSRSSGSVSTNTAVKLTTEQVDAMVKDFKDMFSRENPKNVVAIYDEIMNDPEIPTTVKTKLKKDYGPTRDMIYSDYMSMRY